MNAQRSDVRQATVGDRADIAALLGQLGYPSTSEACGERLRRLESSLDARAFVLDHGGRVVGLATSHVFQSIHANEPVAWLTTLVVDIDHRGHRFGRLLLDAVEELARSRGAVRVSVTSGTHRVEAHGFYEHNGYEESGVRLTKGLRGLISPAPGSQGGISGE